MSGVSLWNRFKLRPKKCTSSKKHHLVQAPKRAPGFVDPCGQLLGCFEGFRAGTNRGLDHWSGETLTIHMQMSAFRGSFSLRNPSAIVECGLCCVKGFTG